MQKITIQGLMKICKVNTPQVMLLWVKNHLAEINTDGEHAKKEGKSWLFDEIAVNRIIELRGDAIPARAERETKEQAELRRAQILLTKTQHSIIELQSKALENAQHIIELTKAQTQAEAHSKILEERLESTSANLKGTQAQLATATSEKEQLKAELDSLRALYQSQQEQQRALAQQQQALEREKLELERQLIEEKSKGFFDRLFNR